MLSVHIFCSVIDNFGDLGVCWRLARQLSAEHGAGVVLLVDDLAAFQRLDTRVNPERSEQMLDGLKLLHWRSEEPLVLVPAALVIEGFACTLPEHYRAQISAETVWISLDYLSAEAWIDDCHGLSSPQHNGASTTFWFPGFSARSGGLLRERELLDRLSDSAHIHDFYQRHGLPAPHHATPRIALFCYESDAISALLRALHQSNSELIICAGKALTAVNELLPSTLLAGERMHYGQCMLYALPMLAPTDFDLLLASCDLNIMRGEDSFVRAQWAAKPLLWHIYPQDELAHEVKLAAWLERVETMANTSIVATKDIESSQHAQNTWLVAQWAWIRNELTATHIHALLAELKPLTAMMQHWREHLMRTPDLATQLMRFYANQVESTPEKTHPDKPL